MSKKYMPLWREAHFEIKILKTLGFTSFLEVQISPRFTILHYTTLHSITLHSNQGSDKDGGIIQVVLINIKRNL